MKRSEAREKVFRIIFQKEFHDDFNDMYLNLVQEEQLSGVQGEYAVSAIKGIVDKNSEIDRMIVSNLKGWTLDRLPKAAMAILRLGLYELYYDDSIPDIAAIDEAVKLAHMYCDEKDCVFINGLLHSVYESKRSEE